MLRAVEMTLDAFFAGIDADNRRKPGTHRLGPALSDRELLLWEKAHPGMTVPEDLVALLRRSNGLGICRNPDSPGGADCCFHPLKDVRHAGKFMYEDGSAATSIPASWYALAQDADGTSVLTVDMATGEVFVVDPIDSSEATILFGSFEGALEWLSEFFPELS